ncbi:MAG: SDR family NAD(P)-dependent oxidoreductase [Deltaproteobacteria bacterium]|nr:SDR family NAD(P)-dependent oxidoreductase [Deltaproteobacteria bacterium]
MTAGLDRWRGKVALVTGASSGIGSGIALALAGMGMRVALAGRRQDRLRKVASEVERLGSEALTLVVDLRSEEALMAMFSRIRERWGGVDVLINNAGLGRSEPMIHTDPALLREMLEVNVWAATLCILESLKDMQGKEDDAIINIASLAAHRVVPGRNVTYYAATKHALKAITEGLRSELQAEKSPIKIGLISPGVVETEFHQSANPTGSPQPYATPPLDPADIAHAVLYMLSTARNVQVNDIWLRPISQFH